MLIVVGGLDTPMLTSDGRAVQGWHLDINQMQIPHSFATMHGRRHSGVRNPMISVTLTQSELHTLSRAIERDAREAERDGHLRAAETLFWRAAALREAVR